jgi:predicted nucleic acid-binding protein
MSIIDANLLLYAYNAEAPQQPIVAKWLAKLLASGEPIALPWVTVWAFIRISTNSRIWANPRPAREAFAIVGEWLRQPGVVTLQPGPLTRGFWKNSLSTAEQPVHS